MKQAEQRISRPELWLVGVVVFAAFTRFVGLDFDQGHHFHPDERAIVSAIERLSFDPRNLRLNPEFFAYGSFPIYVDAVAAKILGALYRPLRNYDNVILIARGVSAFAGTLTVIALVLLGARLYDRKVGLVAGLLLAACVLHIQNSHFGCTDVFLTCVVLLSLSAMIGIVQRGALRDYVYSGVAIGLAMATKFSAAPLFAPLGIAVLVRSLRERRALLGAVVALAVFFVAFFVGQPYAILVFDEWRADIAEQSRMVRNAGLFPYTNQYIGVPKYAYEIVQLVIWGMAPPLGILAVLATALRPIGALRERSAAQLVLLAWVLPFFVVTGSFDVKFVRYLLPIYPIMILWAAAWLCEKAERSRLGRAALWGVCAGTVLFALAFMSIYQRPHTVVSASEWVHRHVPAGATILSQHWDEGFPFTLPGVPARSFKVVEVGYYEPDSPAKMRQLSEQLARGDYIAFQTKRLYGALTQAAEKFPLSNKYFYLLFAGDLGYELVYDATSRPNLLGLEIPYFSWDELADESFTVYDHPKVLIFQNKGRLSADLIADRILKELPSRKLTRSEILLARAADRGVGGVEETPPVRSSWLALIWFSVVVELLGLAAYAVLRRWLRVPGTYALAKVIGVLIFAYVPWLLASIPDIQVGFTRNTLVVVFLALLLLGGRARRGWESAPERPEWWPAEVVFWGVFLFFIAVRAFNPEVFWGEKPMDFSFLNAITRSTRFPPPEPWAAGYSLHYSYFGHVMVAALGKLCHIHPAVTFNLGISLIGGLTAAAAFAAGCALSDRWRVGMLAAFFATFIGNLAGPREYLSRRSFNFDYFWATSRVIKDTINEYPFWSFLFADLHAHVLVMPFTLSFVTLAIWWVRRNAHLHPEPWEAGSETVAEVRTLPLLVLLGLTLGAIMVTNTWSTFTYLPFLPFLLGSVYLARAPLGGVRLGALLLLVGLLLLALARPYVASYAGLPVQPYEQKALLAASGLLLTVAFPATVLTSAAVVACGFALFTPYWLDYRPPPPNWGFEGDAWAQLYDFVTIFGLFLLAAIPFVFALWRRQLLPVDRERLGLLRTLAMWAVGLAALIALLVSMPGLRALAGVSTQGSVRVGLAILGVLALTVSLHARARLRRRVIGLLVAFAFFVTTGVDVIHIWDRMNTVFKFYLESWFLFAIAAAAAVGEISAGLVQSRLLRNLWRGALGLAIAAGLFTAITATYGVINTRRVETPRPTLDGAAYLPLRDPQEAAAFEWINRNIAGIPVLAEAYGPSYQDYARVSMNTGLPIVLGWDYHLTQRSVPHAEIAQRKADLQRLYTSDSKQTVRGVLQRYKVSLVYVGALERRAYAGGNLARFKEWTDLLTPVYQNPGVTIFGVNGQFTGAMPVTTIETIEHIAAGAGEEPAVAGAPGVLSQPRGIAVDAEGNIYVADFGFDRIQKFSRSLEFLKLWGGKGSAPGEFKQPCEVAIGPDGNVYVADTWNQRVQVFTKDGDYLREWGGPFYGPRGIAASSTGKIYLADTGNHRIRRFDLDGKEELTWGGNGSNPGQFKEPYGVALDVHGDVYVSDNLNGRLQIFDPDGRFETAFPVEGWEAKVFSEPKLTVTPDNLIWVTVPARKVIRAYDRSGTLVREINGRQFPSALFEQPLGIAYSAAAGELIVTDLENRLGRIPVAEAMR